MMLVGLSIMFLVASIASSDGAKRRKRVVGCRVDVEKEQVAFLSDGTELFMSDIVGHGETVLFDCIDAYVKLMGDKRRTCRNGILDGMKLLCGIVPGCTDCSHFAYCGIGHGEYECICEPGYLGDGKICKLPTTKATCKANTPTVPPETPTPKPPVNPNVTTTAPPTTTTTAPPTTTTTAITTKEPLCSNFQMMALFMENCARFDDIHTTFPEVTNCVNFLVGFSSCVMDGFTRSLHKYCEYNQFVSSLKANLPQVETILNGFDPILCLNPDNDDDLCDALQSIPPLAFRCLKQLFIMKPHNLDQQVRCNLYNEGLLCMEQYVIHKGKYCTFDLLQKIVSTYVGHPGTYPFIGKVEESIHFEECPVSSSTETCTDVETVHKYGVTFCHYYIKLAKNDVSASCTFLARFVKCIAGQTKLFKTPCTTEQISLTVKKADYIAKYPDIDFLKCKLSG